MQTESRCRGEKRRDVRLFGLIPTLLRREVPTRDMWNAFTSSRTRLGPSRSERILWTINIVRSRRRVSTPTRVEVERRTHGSHARRARSFRQYRRECTGGGSRSTPTSSSLETSAAVWPRARTASCSGTCGVFARIIRWKAELGVGNYSSGIRDNPATIFIDHARLARP